MRNESTTAAGHVTLARGGGRDHGAGRQRKRGRAGSPRKEPADLRLAGAEPDQRLAVANSQFGTGDPSYRVKNGIVYLSGSVSSPTGNGSAVTLPQAAWPTHWLYFTVNTAQGHASLSIRPTGQLTVFGGTGQPDETALSGISYQVSS